MDLFWSIAYSLGVALLIWLLHSQIGVYPPPLPRSTNPRLELVEALCFWGLAVALSATLTLVVIPALDQQPLGRAGRELVLLPVLGSLYLVLPTLVLTRLNGWKARDFGLTWRSQSRGVALFAVVTGLVIGTIGFITNRTVMGIDALSWVALVLLLFTNSFTEEFYHRGVIQSLLERAGGQRAAVLGGGVLFGLTHLVFDFSRLMDTQGIVAVLFALLLQTMAGWMFGITFMKTRTLWPGVVLHYLVNWLPSILARIAA